MDKNSKYDINIDIDNLKQDLEQEYNWWNNYINSSENLFDLYKIFLFVLNSTEHIEVADNLQKHYNADLNCLNDEILVEINFFEEVIINNKNQVEQVINKFVNQLKNLLLIPNQNISTNKLSYYMNNIDYYIEKARSDANNITKLLLDKADISELSYIMDKMIISFSKTKTQKLDSLFWAKSIYFEVLFSLFDLILDSKEIIKTLDNFKHYNLF